MASNKRRAAGKNRGQERQRNAAVKRARQLRSRQQTCGCGKIGYPNEFDAMDSVGLGAGHAGIRAYQCTTTTTGLWHTTSKAHWGAR